MINSGDFSDWVMIPEGSDSKDVKTNPLSQSVFDRLGAMKLVQLWCHQKTGRTLPREITERIVHKAGFVPPKASLARRIFNKLFTPDGKSLVSALANKHWNRAYQEASALGDSKVAQGSKVIEFLRQKRFPEAAFLAPLCNIESLLEPIKSVEGIELLNDVGTLLFQVYSKWKTLIDEVETALLLRHIQLEPKNPAPYFRLALTAHKTSNRFAIMDKNDLMKKVIEFDDTNPRAYYFLAKWMKPDETLHLNSGMPMTRAELCKTALRFNPKDSEALYLLASCLGPQETVRLYGGEEVDAVQLYLRATKIDPKYHQAFFQIAKISNDLGQKIESMKHAIAIESRNPEYFYFLATLLSPNDTVAILGKEMKREDLYRSAIANGTKRSSAYVEIAKVLKEGKETNIGNKTWTQFKLLKQALFLDPNNAEAIQWMSKTEEVKSGAYIIGQLD